MRLRRSELADGALGGAARARASLAGSALTGHGDISASSSSFSNSGAKRATIASGSGHILASVIRPNCTPPAYDRIDTPMPMSPDCGTQNIT